MRLFALYLGLAWQSVSPDVVQHVQAGITAQKQGRLTDAIAEFREVTELAPSLPAAFVNLGAAYIQNGDYSSAIAPLKRSLDLNPDLIGAQQMLGYALLEQGYTAEAVPHLRKAGVKDALGIAEFKLGHYLEAITDLEAALAKHPNDPDLLYYLSRASGLLSKEASDTLESAYPDSARTHQSLGENYAALRRIPEALKEYREALRLQPKAPGLHLAIGQIYAGQKDWPKAADEFHAETVIQPGDAESVYRYGNALLQEGKMKDATSGLQRADRLQPNMPETLYALGKANSLNGNTVAAEQSWRHLLSIEKTTSLAAETHFALANLYRKQGKSAEAAQQMEAFRKLQPSTGSNQK